MRIVVTELQDVVAADAVVEALAARAQPVLGVATGSSPLALYAELARRVDAGSLDLSATSAFALDEYVGLDPTHPQSYAAFLHREVTVPLRLDPAAVHVPRGDSLDPDAACLAYDRAIRDAGGVDVQIAGIGSNGHLAFNEPGSPFDSRTRVVVLSSRTRADNARFFVDAAQVPQRAMTQGIGTVLEARRIVVVVSGRAKAEAVRAAVAGPRTPDCPASALQGHPDTVLVLDPAAASLLERETTGAAR